MMKQTSLLVLTPSPTYATRKEHEGSQSKKKRRLADPESCQLRKKLWKSWNGKSKIQKEIAQTLSIRFKSELFGDHNINLSLLKPSPLSQLDSMDPSSTPNPRWKCAGLKPETHFPFAGLRGRKGANIKANYYVWV